MTIRLQIILGMVVIQPLLFLLMVFHSEKTIRDASEHELLSRGEIVSSMIASSAQSAVLGNDLATLESIVKQVGSNHDIVYVRILANKIVLAAYGTDQLPGSSFTADLNLDSAKSDHIFDIASAISVAGQQIGTVQIGFSIRDIENAIASAHKTTISSVAISAAITILYAFIIGHFITKRLNELRRNAGAIANGEFGSQSPVSGRDEITELMKAFNEMSVKLKQLNDSRLEREKEIIELNTDLERRVADRTNSLNELNRQLEYQALHDALTVLPNRVLFHERLNSLIRASKRSKNRFAVIAIDLNNFKEINDSLGHNAGDLALQHTAQACLLALRESDTVARMGGDEFAILLPNCDAIDNALLVCRRIAEHIATPFAIENRMIELSASLGVSLYPEHGENETMLLNNCDVAMYEAKKKRLGIKVFGPELYKVRNDHLMLKTELRRAIENGELILEYQPKVELKNRTMSGVEALVRWRHPSLGILYPDKFISIAEEEQLINPLTKIVVKLALDQTQQWYRDGLEIPTSVNISTTNLQDNEFPNWVKSVLESYEIPNRLLELEITETALMTNPIQAMESVRLLAEIGVQVSIDDFGTGYSSMAYLQKLLVAKIKIDKTFVMKMGRKERDEVIVRSTIDLAHNLGLKAVAEGVEDETAWKKLQDLGCDSAQGYFMSKPIVGEKIIAWAENMNWKIKSR